jgi:FtsZ-binding cell division protein ZapB
MSADPADAVTETKRLALQLAAVVDALERHSIDAVGAIDDSRIALKRAVDELGSRGNQIVTEVSRHAQAETRAAAERALSESLAGFKAQLDAAARSAVNGAEALQRERERLAKQQRSAFWVGSVALLLGALAVVGGSTWWVMQQRTEVARLEFARALHEASARGALVPCGDTLCARVGDSPRRAGRNGEYLVVE